MSVIKLGFEIDELIKTERIHKTDILEIKEWQNLTRYPKLTDEQIALFLISCQNNKTVVKETINVYFQTKLSLPDVFCNLSMESEKMQRLIGAINVAVMPKRYKDYVIMIARLKDSNYKKLDVMCGAQLCAMILDYMLFNDPPKGLITLYDCKGFRLMHFTFVTVTNMQLAQKLIHFSQNGMPLMINKVHVFNINYIACKGIELAKPLLKSELLAKIEMHNGSINSDWFHKNCISKEYLPKEYGGDLEPLAFYHEETMQKLREMKPFFEAQQQQVYG